MSRTRLSHVVPSRALCAGAVLLFLAACQAPPRREPVLAAFAMTDVRMVERSHWGESFTPPDAYTGDTTGSYDLDHTLRARYTEYRNAEGDPVRRTALRNEIAYTMLTLVKHYHDGTTDDVYELTATISTAFDFFSMAMGGLGAATGSAADKAGYSALAAFGIGARSSLAKNILAEQTTQAILQQMDAMRLKQEAKVRRALKADDDKYPLHAALTDLFDFYTAGSVKDAVAELAKSAQDAKEQAKAMLDRAKEDR